MTVDIHAHIVDLRHLRELAALLHLEPQETPDGKTLYRHDGFTVAWSRPDMFDIPHRLREMDRKGADRDRATRERRALRVALLVP